MKTAADEGVYGTANMTADTVVESQVHLSDAETEATTWRFADMEHIAKQLEWEIYGIISNEQMRFKMELSTHLIEFEAWWEAIGVQELQKTIEQRVICFRYSMMHHVSRIS